MPTAKRNPRLDQLLAGLGYGSRREVERHIKNGVVSIEGELKPKADMRVDPDLVRFAGKALDHPHGLIIALHKPVGYVCTHSSNEGPSVYELLPQQWNFRSPSVESIGRLDKDTSGLLLLTDQHELIHQLTSPKHHVDKVYVAELEAPVTQKMIDILATGTLLLHGETKPCLPAKLESLGGLKAQITIAEGRYHQVRRMLGSVGAPVLGLHRAKFGEVSLGDLAPGTYLELPLTSFSS